MKTDDQELTVADLERVLKGRWPQDSHIYHLTFTAGKWTLAVFPKHGPASTVRGATLPEIVRLAESTTEEGR